MYNILVANDDGIKFEGINQLVAALSRVGKVYVFAPHEQRSASSQALTIGKPFFVRPYNMDFATEAYEVGGTPADCVRVGLQILREKGISVDLVCTGINHGANLGSDTMYSGTVSAAAEGVFAGLPAMAVSVVSHEAEYFKGACSLAVQLIPKVLETKGKGCVVNVNTPNLPPEKIKGVKKAKLGIVKYDDVYDVVGSGESNDLGTAGNHAGQTDYIYAGKLIKQEKHCDDVDACLIDDGYATVSVVKYDLNDYEGLSRLDSWELAKINVNEE